GFNFRHGPFAGLTRTARDMRRAFSLSIDRAHLVDAACDRGLACTRSADGLVPPGLQGTLDATGALSGFEPGTARNALHQADPSGGAFHGLTYGYPDQDPDRTVAKELVQQWLRNLGVAVRPVAVPPTQFDVRRDSGEFSLFAMSRRA